MIQPSQFIFWNLEPVYYEQDWKFEKDEAARIVMWDDHQSDPLFSEYDTSDASDDGSEEEEMYH